VGRAMLEAKDVQKKKQVKNWFRILVGHNETAVRQAVRLLFHKRSKMDT
jgi:hypothetical protein